MPEGPLLLTSVKPQMLTADFWIARMRHPDRVLKSPQELKKFNDYIDHAISENQNIFKMDPSVPGKPLADQLTLEYQTVSNRKLFDVEGNPIPKIFFEKEIWPVVAVDRIPAQIRLKWGAAIRPTSVRALPTEVKMLEAIGDIEFDQLQFTLIKLWTPIAIYHTSGNGQWYYVQAPYARGWVRSQDVAIFEDREELRKYADPYNAPANYLIVTGESIPLFRDSSFQKIILRASMGTMIPIASQAETVWTVWLPRKAPDGRARREKAYVHPQSDVSRGFLPYTQRNVVNQAFKLLGTRYGWGGSYNGRDCSGFVHDVFLTVGVALPRGSKAQSLVGTPINYFSKSTTNEEKIAFLRTATPGITLLRMPLHMMLYLGEVEGRFYVIHSTWAERISMTSDAKNRINQVVVSDLSLNGQSYLGSLLDRIISINEIY